MKCAKCKTEDARPGQRTGLTCHRLAMRSSRRKQQQAITDTRRYLDEIVTGGGSAAALARHALYALKAFHVN